jgi:hypothetical protein
VFRMSGVREVEHTMKNKQVKTFLFEQSVWRHVVYKAAA